MTRSVPALQPTLSLARALCTTRRLAWALVFGLLASGCASLPPQVAATPSHGLDAGPGSRLGRAGAALAPPAQDGNSSLVALASGADAWAARLMLVERAERSVDLQYYLFRPDASGNALAVALRRAAERGVRVRLLLDDWGAKPDAEALAAMASHPLIEVRLYNPLAHTGSPLLSVVLDFDRTQRRMHNKLLLADGQAAIVGGRNIGDEYFARHAGLAFGDLDVLAFGAVVPQFAAGFDRFWNESPVSVVDGRKPAPSTSPPVDAAPHNDTLAWRVFESRLTAGTLPHYRAPAQAVQDPPDKAGPNRTASARHLGQEIARVMGEARTELLLVSPYFVPGAGGVEQLRALRRRGVRVVVVTNSLAATDVPPVHAGYARYRKALLQAGVELHELRPDAAQPPPARSHTGTSRVSLHAKVIVVDGVQMFVGSMNIDPRSVQLNTENGMVFSSADIAGNFTAGLQRALADAAWRLALEDGKLVWHGQRHGEQTRLHREPDAGTWLRLQTTVLSWLPIEGLL